MEWEIFLGVTQSCELVLAALCWGFLWEGGDTQSITIWEMTLTAPGRPSHRGRAGAGEVAAGA